MAEEKEERIGKDELRQMFAEVTTPAEGQPPQGEAPVADDTGMGKDELRAMLTESQKQDTSPEELVEEDYEDLSYAANAGAGVALGTDDFQSIPGALANIGKKAWDVAMPLDSMTFSGTGGFWDNTRGNEDYMRGIDKLWEDPSMAADGVGRMGAGFAGAKGGAVLGSALGPLGTAAGGAIGFGAGTVSYEVGKWLWGAEESKSGKELVRDVSRDLTTDVLSLGAGRLLSAAGKGVAKVGSKTGISQAAERGARTAKSESTYMNHMRRWIQKSETGITKERVEEIAERIGPEISKKIALHADDLGKIEGGRSYEKLLDVVGDGTDGKWLNEAGDEATRLLKQSTKRHTLNSAKAITKDSAEISVLRTKGGPEGERLVKKVVSNVEESLKTEYEKLAFAKESGIDLDKLENLSGGGRAAKLELDDAGRTAKGQLDDFQRQWKKRSDEIAVQRTKAKDLQRKVNHLDNEIERLGKIKNPTTVQRGELARAIDNADRAIPKLEELQASLAKWDGAIESVDMAPDRFWRTWNNAVGDVKFEKIQDTSLANRALAEVRLRGQESLTDGMDRLTATAYREANLKFGDVKDLQRWLKASTEKELAAYNQKTVLKQIGDVFNEANPLSRSDPPDAFKHFIKAQKTVLKGTQEGKTPFTRNILDGIARRWPKSLGENPEAIFSVRNSQIFREANDIVRESLEQINGAASPEEMQILADFVNSTDLVLSRMEENQGASPEEKKAALKSLMTDPKTSMWFDADKPGMYSNSGQSLAGEPLSVEDETKMLREIDNDETLSNMQRSKIKRQYRKTGKFPAREVEQEDFSMTQEEMDDARKKVTLQRARQDMFNKLSATDVAEQGRISNLNSRKKAVEGSIMNVSDELGGALDVIKEFEGLKLQRYKDSVGVPTIGYGHTGSGVKKGSISEEEAEELLLKDLKTAESAVDRLVKVPLSDEQRGALVSFTFNLGQGNLAESTLLKLLNKGDYEGAAEQFDRWVHAGGKKLRGLVRRRKREKQLFLAGLRDDNSRVA